VWSSVAMLSIGVAYLITLIIGVARYGVRPIADPILAIMEVLTLVSAPIVVVLMVAIHDFAKPKRKAYGVLAIAFGSIFAALTSSVHFVELTALRQQGAGGIVWPSSIYAVELLAWDVFLGLALLFAGAALGVDMPHRTVRRSLYLAGGLCLLGTIGPAVGDMRLQLVGVVGYAVVLPVACVLLARLFLTYDG